MKTTFDALNIQLPTHYCHGDKKWLIDRLSELPIYERKHVIEKYSAVYSKTYEREPIVHKKEGKARRAANMRLRECVERFQTINNGGVYPPPKATSYSEKYLNHNLPKSNIPLHQNGEEGRKGQRGGRGDMGKDGSRGRTFPRE